MNLILFISRLQNMDAQLQVILKDEICKLSLPSGIPSTIVELKQIVQETFAIEDDFSLQFQDKDFDNQFCTLQVTVEVKDKDTIKVVFPELSVITFTPLQDSTGFQEFQDISLAQSSQAVCSSPSPIASSSDTILSSPGSTSSTIILSSPGSTSSLRLISWPPDFDIPTFSLDTELIHADEAYRKDGTLLILQLNQAFWRS